MAWSVGQPSSPTTTVYNPQFVRGFADGTLRGQFSGSKQACVKHSRRSGQTITDRFE